MQPAVTVEVQGRIRDFPDGRRPPAAGSIGTVHRSHDAAAKAEPGREDPAGPVGRWSVRPAGPWPGPLAALACLVCLVVLVPLRGDATVAVAVLAVTMTLAGPASIGAVRVRPLALFVATFAAVSLLALAVPALSLWPVPLAVSLVVFWSATRAGPLAWSAPWLRAGRIDRRSLALIAAIVPVAAAALVVWSVVDGDAAAGHDVYRDLAERYAPWQLVLGAVGFCLINAAAEELAFNGVVQTAVSGAFATPVAVASTACVFGAAHWYGFPSGWLGVLLAASYGLVLGALRAVSGGLLAPWIAHVFADATIVVLLLSLW